MRGAGIAALAGPLDDDIARAVDIDEVAPWPPSNVPGAALQQAVAAKAGQVGIVAIDPLGDALPVRPAPDTPIRISIYWLAASA